MLSEPDNHGVQELLANTKNNNVCLMKLVKGVYFYCIQYYDAE
jgi:hypothetical protein